MVATTTKLTLDEYRDREATSEVRHEYRNGEVIEVPGGSISHSRIAGVLYSLLEDLLEDSDCEPFNGELRIWIPERNQGTYPDVMAVVGEAVLNGNRTDEILNPTLVAEVLSPSTSGYDRGDKFAAYRTIPSFREYLLIEQDQPAIEHYWKIDDSSWQLQEIRGLESTIELRHIPAQLPLQQIYRRIRFES
ncbi:MAG: Uma2 family endonuclease [Geitlerinemataceae cyanobacterium]